MTIIEDVRQHTAQWPGVVLTIGSFDGIHLGHQRILNRVIEKARARNGTAAVLTMQPHPREFFTPNQAPNLLTTPAKKQELFEAHGMDAVFILPFNTETAELSREAFVEEIVLGRCRAEALVVGHDFCFGRGAEGDYEFLREAGAQHGFEAEQTPPLLIGGERVSSTLIRERILLGDLGQAARLLGRRYSVQGEVTPGRGIGSTIGFPTANIRPLHSAVPAQGVYTAEAILNGTAHMAAVNIGIAPTIRHEDVTVEAHILDFDANIHGEPIEVVFHERIRPERKFPSREALIEQIGRDVETVRAYFG